MSGLFQSTHPQGVGPTQDRLERVLWQFQSTHPQGVGHGLIMPVIRLEDISIHPPARGGTKDKLSAFRDLVISIHPPARGGTVSITENCGVGAISIHPPARGGTAKVHKTNFAFYAKATKLRWFPARVQHFSAAICQLIAI